MSAPPELLHTMQGHKNGPVGTKYRSYKRATEKLAGWLATTAKGLGLESGIASAGEPESGAYQGSTHVLKIHQFTTLTDVILEAVPQIRVPVEIVNHAHQAFKVRQERAELLRGIDAESDERHQHVITVISEVFQKLKGRMQALNRTKNDGPDAEAQDILIPSFVLLKVEPLEAGDSEDEKDCANAPPSVEQRPKMTKNKKSKLLKKKKKEREQLKPRYLLDEDEDPYFVLMCLLADLRSMRDYIKEIWQEYKEERTDLITVSLTTNATFDIIRTYEEDFPALSTLLKDYSKTMKLILSRKLGEADEGLALFLEPTIDVGKYENDIVTVGRTLSKIPKLADMTFANAFYFLNGPRHLIIRRRGNKVQSVENADELFGEYNPELDREELNLVQRLQEDIQILTVFADTVYKSYNFQACTDDHFTMQWRKEFPKAKNDTISLAQAFGAQIHLDIHHILRTEVGNAFEDLYKASEKILNSLHIWLEDTVHDESHFHGDFLQSLLRSLKRRIDFIRVNATEVTHTMYRIDFMHNQLESARSVQGDEATDKAMSKMFFWEANPLLCGIVLFELVHTFRNAGVSLAYHYDTMRRAGQLYYVSQMHRKAFHSAAYRSEAKMPIPQFQGPCKWDDMDFVFEMYEEESFFEGDRLPQCNWDVVQFHDELNEDLSIKYEARQRGIRSGHFGPVLDTPSSKGRKGGSGSNQKQIQFAKDLHSFEPVAITHRLYFSKYIIWADRDTDPYWTLETLQALLETQLQNNELRRIRDNNKLGKRKRKQSSRTTMEGIDGDISQITILKTLKETLQSEARALNFDFVSFHTQCHKLLCRVRDDNCHRYSEADRADATYFSDSNISTSISDLLIDVNMKPSSPSVIKASYVSGLRDVASYTTEGHIDIDTSIKRYLDDRQCKDQEIRKADMVRGVDQSVRDARGWIEYLGLASL